jgi:hypothetical protein
VSDEIRCTATRNEDLPVYEYLEEEEEIDENGDFRTTQKNAEIKPGWIAASAQLVNVSRIQKKISDFFCLYLIMEKFSSKKS